MHVPLLNDVIIIFGLASGVLLACHRLRIPAVVGFLLTGLLVGPHGLGLIQQVEEVEILAEIGVVLLLFTIGVEFSLKELLQIKRSVLLGGSMQVVLTVAAVYALFTQLGKPVGEAIFIGFLVSLSSTAIVLKLLQDRAEIESPHGRSTLGVLIFQDMAVVPMMLLLPFLAGDVVDWSGSLVLLIGKVIAIMLLVSVSAKWIVPHLLYQVARTRSRELFLVSVLVICFAVALLTQTLGLSLALGAFLAGLIISESPYSHQTLSNILPFRDVFTSLFFVSIGMLLDLKVLLNNPLLIGLLMVGVMLLKSTLACLAISAIGYPLRTALRSGIPLCQVGEFSFILSIVGIEYGLLTGLLYQQFLAVSVLTMAATPFIMAAAPDVARRLAQLPWPRRIVSGRLPAMESDAERRTETLTDHLIIVGFGFNGRNVARAARAAGIRYVIIEMNPETVRREKPAGEPIEYGDATQHAVLDHAGITRARVLVVAIPDPAATRRVIVLAREMNPKLHIVARTRLVQEMAPLHDLGANEVIPEEFETSVELFSRVLSKYLIPKNEIEQFVAEARAGGYQMFRSLYLEEAPLCDIGLHLPDIEVSTVRLSSDSPFAGKTLGDIDLRKKYQLTLLAIRRGSHILPNPDGGDRLESGDILIILGAPKVIAEGSALINPPRQDASSQYG